jgi:hypothetical protein
VPDRVDATALSTTQLDHNEIDRGHHGEDFSDRRGQQDTVSQQYTSQQVGLPSARHDRC